MEGMMRGPKEQSGFTMLEGGRVKEKKLEDDEDWLMLKRSNSKENDDGGGEDTVDDTPTKKGEGKNEVVTMIANGSSSMEWTNIVDSHNSSTNNISEIKNFCCNNEVSTNLADLYYFTKKNIVFFVVFFLSGTYIHEIFFSDEKTNFPTTPLNANLHVSVPKQNRIDARDLLAAPPTKQQILIDRLKQKIEEVESLQSLYIEELSKLARERNHWQGLAVACAQEKREINQAFYELEESVKESKRLVPLGYTDYSLAYNLSDVLNESSSSSLLPVGSKYSALIVPGSTALTTVANRVDDSGNPSLNNSSRLEPIHYPSSISDNETPNILQPMITDGSIAEYPNSSDVILAASTALVETPSSRLKNDFEALPIGTSTKPRPGPTCRDCPSPLYPPEASTVSPWHSPPVPHPAKVLWA